MKDPRVNVDMEVDQFGRMPLSELRYIGDLPCLKWLMALRGSQLNWELKGDDEQSSIGAVREKGHFEVFEFVQRFRRDPSRVSHEIRQDLKLPKALAASLFAILVFLGEELLQLKAEEAKNDLPSARFFLIAQRLPMELQMILCNHVYQSSKETILTVDSEPAFRSLAWSCDAPVALPLTAKVPNSLRISLGPSPTAATSVHQE